MQMNDAVAQWPRLAISRPAKIALAIGALAGVMAVAIFWRVSGRPDTPPLLPILAWQWAVWLPWLGYFYAVRFLAKRFPVSSGAALPAFGLHALAALLVAGSHLGWFWQLSRLASPFVGLPGTKYGAYAFFFVFWCLIDLLLYWAILGAQGRAVRAGAERRPAGASAPRPGEACDHVQHFTVRKGRDRHIVHAEDIQRIEAQGYYAALHTATSRFLLRKSLTTLENELDPRRFVRVHRSTIVNVDKVRRLHGAGDGALDVVMADGVRCRASRAGRRRLKTLLNGRP